VSPTYLYCITARAAPEPPAQTVGLDGAPVRRLGDAWVSDIPARSVRATVDRIRAHDAVVAAALGTGSTPLPARFGQAFASDDECLKTLSAKNAQLSAGLARVAGMVEMTVLLRAEAPALDTTSGTAYLQSLARRDRAIDFLRRAARDVNARLGVYVRESAEGISGSVATLSHLVERGALDQYKSGLETAVRDLTGVEVRILGPGAPYSFGARE
jgi:hypothetical protein